MNSLTELTPGLHYVGVNDRTTHRFEALWSLPYGVSYNSYLLADEKIALIDGMEEGFAGVYFDRIAEVIGSRPVDYLIVNHMEPDHSGAIALLRQRYPAMRIVGNAKTLEMLRGFYGIEEGCLQIGDGDTLSLGRHTLRFYLTPMIHWPETMMTWCEELKALFSGDAFGSFGALNGGIVDSELEVEPFWDEMRRYYACIVSKYGRPVQMALRKLAGLKIEWLCSTHGPVWRERVADVLELYEKMSRHEGERGVVIAYGSMYGNTARAAEEIARELAVRGVKPIVVHNLSVSDPSAVLRDVHKYKALIVGSPTYNGELFPEVAALLDRLSSRGVAPRIFAGFGGMAWAGTTPRHWAEFCERAKWSLCSPAMEFRQGYSCACRESCGALAEAVARKLEE